MQTQNLAGASQINQAKYDELLAALIQLRDEFICLQNKLLNDTIFHEEHELYIHRKPKSPRNISPIFNELIIDPFRDVCQRYSDIKEKLKPVIGEETINEIEDTIVNAAKNNESKLNELIYFPIYQKIHQDAVDVHAQIQREKIAQAKSEIETIEANYRKRKVEYDGWYLGAGLCSIFVVGIPFLILTAIVHGIDKLITATKVAILNNTISVAENDISNHFDPNANEINKKIMGNGISRLMQGFFSASKNRHQKCMHEVETYMPETTKPPSNIPGKWLSS